MRHRERYKLNVIIAVVIIFFLLAFAWWSSWVVYDPQPTKTPSVWPTRVTATEWVIPSRTAEVTHTQVATPIMVTATSTIMYTITQTPLPVYTQTITPIATRYYVTATPDKYPICTTWGIRWVTWEVWDKVMGWKTCPDWYTTTTKIAR